MDTIYTEVHGCNTHVGGKRGVTVGFKHGVGNVLRGAFVRLDEGGMLYVETGWPVAGPDGRMTHHEVQSSRLIDREEFDQITGIAQIRTELGWRDVS